MADDIGKWVRDAFEDAVNNTPFDDPEQEAEYQAYRRTIVANREQLIFHCGNAVGAEKMNRLSKVVIESGNTKTLAEFIKALLTVGFSLGYKARREEEE